MFISFSFNILLSWFNEFVVFVLIKSIYDKGKVELLTWSLISILKLGPLIDKVSTISTGSGVEIILKLEIKIC